MTSSSRQGHLSYSVAKIIQFLCLFVTQPQIPDFAVLKIYFLRRTRTKYVDVL